jgi:predicted cupin superfamily sugar epimerase
MVASPRVGHTRYGSLPFSETRMVRRSTPGAYSFAATQLSPGFDYADFEIGYRDDLVRRYPAFAREMNDSPALSFC